MQSRSIDNSLALLYPDSNGDRSLTMLNSAVAIVKIPGYMTTAQAAEYLGITAGRVRQLVTMGVFTPEKAGNTNLIPVEQVESYEQNRNKAGWQKGRPRKP